MGRFYKTHTRWIANTAVKKAEVTPVVEEEKTESSKKEEPVVKEILKEEKPVVEKAIPAEAMVIKKKETKEGIICEIVTELDCDEIRYNVGSKRVTEKNKSRCKRYEGKFTLEEPAVINASAFKEDILICSVQG